MYVHREDFVIVKMVLHRHWNVKAGVSKLVFLQTSAMTWSQHSAVHFTHIQNLLIHVNCKSVQGIQ